MTLDSLTPHEGAKKKKKRIGRGQGSGHGKTACKGQKGQKSRSGASIPAGFQGGQMPIYRQLPKRGFKNPFRKVYGVLNVSTLNAIEHDGVIDVEYLQQRGLVRKRDKLVKVLGDGEITKAVRIKVHAVSKAAREKIEKAGGSIEIIS
ncbi:MAG: 50S ribosomal protein L15 [Thermodesulfatator sp.]|nr:MAG: 50S ribosomal protein L15 [Thermodesulfatator sp.]